MTYAKFEIAPASPPPKSPVQVAVVQGDDGPTITLNGIEVAFFAQGALQVSPLYQEEAEELKKLDIRIDQSSPDTWHGIHVSGPDVPLLDEE